MKTQNSLSKTICFNMTMNIHGIRETVEKEAQKSKHPQQAIALFELMSEISEDCFSAGWIRDNGENLWKAKKQFEETHSAIDYGDSEIDCSALSALCELANTCKCWWEWRDDNPRCFLLSEWG